MKIILKKKKINATELEYRLFIRTDCEADVADSELFIHNTIRESLEFNSPDACSAFQVDSFLYNSVHSKIYKFLLTSIR